MYEIAFLQFSETTFQFKDCHKFTISIRFNVTNRLNMFHLAHFNHALFWRWVLEWVLALSKIDILLCLCFICANCCRLHDHVQNHVFSKTEFEVSIDAVYKHHFYAFNDDDKQSLKNSNVHSIFWSIFIIINMIECRRLYLNLRTIRRRHRCCL